jgi:hypothetical protein
MTENIKPNHTKIEENNEQYKLLEKLFENLCIEDEELKKLSENNSMIREKINYQDVNNIPYTGVENVEIFKKHDLIKPGKKNNDNNI